MNIVQMKQDLDNKETPKTSELESKIEETSLIMEDVLQSSKKKVKVERRIKFPINYEDLDSGKKLKSVLVSKIMDSEARLKYDQVLMTLGGGFSFDTFPQAQKTRFQCIARIIAQLESADQWVLEKAGEDLDFCFAIASKLVEHENRYFRYYNEENSSEKKQPRFSIDFPEFEEV